MRLSTRALCFMITLRQLVGDHGAARLHLDELLTRTALRE